MSAEYFLDTNIVVYAFDPSEPDKQAKAKRLAAPRAANWTISWQVVQEFCTVALHKFEKPLNSKDLDDYLELVLLPHRSIHSSPDLYRQAIAIHQATQYRFYDSLIVAAAIHSGARTLYSEDLQDGRSIGDLMIVNPFASP